MKSIKSRIVLFVTAVLLAITAMGSLITAYATEKEQIDSQGSMIYSQELTVDSIGEAYQLTFSIDAKVEFASFELGIQFPGFVKVMEVKVSDELAKLSGNFEYGTDNGETLVKTSFVSSENVTGNVDLFTVTFQVLETGYGAPYLSGEALFTNANYQYFNNVGCAFGSINAGGDMPMPTGNKGDVNLDGEISVADLVMMQRHIVSPKEQLYGTAYSNADIDNDGNVNTIDCQYVQMYLVGELENLNGIGGGVVDPEIPSENQLIIHLILKTADGASQEVSSQPINVAEGMTVKDAVYPYINNIPFKFIMMAYDPYGNQQVEGGMLATDVKEVYLIFENSEASTTMCQVEIVICDQQGVEIKTINVEARQGEPIYSAAIGRTDIGEFGYYGIYYDPKLTNEVTGDALVNGDMTVYVVCPDYKEIPKVTVTVYVVSEDGEMLTSTIDSNVRADRTVWSIVASYCGYSGYRYARMAYDAEGKELVPGDAMVSDGLEVYAIMEKGETQWYPLSVQYMLVSGDNIVSMGGHSSDGTMGNMPLLSQGAGDVRGYKADGVYYDEALTDPVGPYDVLSGETIIYVKLIAPEISGTYDLYGTTMTDQGPMPGTEVIGSVTFEGGVLILNTERLENVGGQYVDLGGMYQAMLGDQDCVMVLVQGTNAYLYYEFYGSDYPVDPSVSAVVGHYEFVADGDDYVLDLYENAVFSMATHGTTMFGCYTYNAETQEIVLDAMGDSARCIYDPVTKTVTPVIEEDDENVVNPDDSENLNGKTFRCPVELEDGTCVQHSLTANDDGSWTLILEPSYAEKYGVKYEMLSLEVYVRDCAMNFFVPDINYALFNIILDTETESFYIYDFVNLSDRTHDDALAKYDGLYTLEIDGEVWNVTLTSSGIADAWCGGFRDVASYIVLEDNLISIGRFGRVEVNVETAILTVIDSTINSGMVGTITQN